MTEFELPFVDAQRGRDGRVRYWYFRRGGRRWRLAGKPGSPAFMADYWRLCAATEPAQTGTPRTNPPGSFGALAKDYFASLEFRERKASTQKIYRLVIEPLAERHGHKPVSQLERKHIKQWRDARGETPGMANMLVKVARLLLSYAVDNDYRTDNPAQRIKLFKLGEHRAWTDDECGQVAVREHAAAGLHACKVYRPALR